MSWQELTSEQALSEGAQLWIVGDLEASQWSHKINWYLNFQLRRAKFHQPREMPRELVSVLQTWEVEAPELDLNPTAPLLVESSKLLPNQMTIQLFNKNFESWLDDAFQLWTDLQRPSVRVFLPKGKSLAQLKSRWQVPDGVSATFVEE